MMRRLRLGDVVESERRLGSPTRAMAARTSRRAATEGVADASVPTAQTAELTVHGTLDGISSLHESVGSLPWPRPVAPIARGCLVDVTTVQVVELQNDGTPVTRCTALVNDREELSGDPTHLGSIPALREAPEEPSPGKMTHEAEESAGGDRGDPGAATGGARHEVAHRLGRRGGPGRPDPLGRSGRQATHPDGHYLRGGRGLP